MNTHRHTSRRQFLKTSGGALVGGVLAVPDMFGAAAEPPTGAGNATASGRLKHDTVHASTVEKNRAFVAEAPRRTRVAADVDVLVIGGGPAGVAAALAAAQQGARVLIIERHGMLGGVWTAGLLNPLFDHVRKGFIVAELVRRLQAANAWVPWTMSHCFDIEVMKLTLEAWCDERKVDYWYHCVCVGAIVEDGVVRGAIVEGKSGREAVLARVCVDASGDGDLAAYAGAGYEFGRTVDGLAQPMTMMFEIEGLPPGYQQRTSQSLYDAMQEAIRQHNLPYQLPIERVNYAPWIINLPRPGAAVVQHTHIYRKSALNTRQLSRATADARRLAREAVEILRGIPGLENVRLIQTAPALGIREARRVRGDHVLTLEDLQAGRRFLDAVTFGAFGVDIHEPAPGAGVPSGHHARMKPYEIPYRCLLPAGLEGLLTAGRCISGTHEAHASYRVTGTCMGMGQGAGVAAAWAAAENTPPRRLDGAQLRKRLEDLKCGFLA